MHSPVHPHESGIVTPFVQHPQGRSAEPTPFGQPQPHVVGQRAEMFLFRLPAEAHHFGLASVQVTLQSNDQQTALRRMARSPAG
jgi:hypothetical protein